MSLNFRRDNRTVEQFAKDIKNAHVLEDKIANALKVQLEEAHNKPVVILDNGVASDGRLLNKLNKHTVDRVFLVGEDRFPVEIKTAPHAKYFTFKVSSLESCFKEDASILVWVKNTDRFYICRSFSIQQMLSLEHKIYHAFSPNDLAVRINEKEIGNYFLQYKWNREALGILSGNN